MSIEQKHYIELISHCIGKCYGFKVSSVSLKLFNYCMSIKTVSLMYCKNTSYIWSSLKALKQDCDVRASQAQLMTSFTLCGSKSVSITLLLQLETRRLHIRPSLTAQFKQRLRQVHLRVVPNCGNLSFVRLLIVPAA